MIPDVRYLLRLHFSIIDNSFQDFRIFWVSIAYDVVYYQEITDKVLFSMITNNHNIIQGDAEFERYLFPLIQDNQPNKFGFFHKKGTTTKNQNNTKFQHVTFDSLLSIIWFFIRGRPRELPVYVLS